MPQAESLRMTDEARAKRTRELFDESYVDKEHMATFRLALSAPDLSSTSPTSSPTTPSSALPTNEADVGRALLDAAANGHGEVVTHDESMTAGGLELQGGVEKLRAVSDFAPINTRVKRRHKSKVSRSSGWSYHIFRYPILFFLLFIIYAEFSCYVLTRQVVNVFEYVVAWTGHKRVLRRQMRRAGTWREWVAAAEEMDKYLGFQAWKAEDEDSQYDWSLIRKVRTSLRTLRAKNDVRGLVGVLEVCLRPNFGGIERVRLYSETFYGTKELIEDYVKEVAAALKMVRESKELPLDDKRRFYKSCNKNFGSTALCLSGGASFGYYHFGVVKAFLEANLLPRVITGTSAGALVAAFVSTRTDEELNLLLVPELADKLTACEESMGIWLKRFWKTGARFDTVQWAEKASFWTHGSLTFREAYERTGRVLNVSVIPHDRHSPTKLLNYLTAPDCVIWSAIIASAAVPGILNPVVLMTKTSKGDIVPWNWGTRFKDGSLRVDIPLQSLHLLFNVNHSIVSQVNPHVHLFFFAPKGTAGRPVAHRKGKGWRGGFVLSAMEQYLKLELTKNFKVIRDLELMPTMLGQDWSSVFLQRFDGSITITPRSRFLDWFHLLTDPDRKELERMMRVGQAATWPKLHMIANRDVIESEILRGRQKVRSQIGRARRLTNPEASHSSTPPRTAAASPLGHAGEDDDETPAPALTHRPSIPIDSDAETKYNDEWQQLRAQGGGTSAARRKAAASSSSNGHRRPSRPDAAVGLGNGRSDSNPPAAGPSGPRRRGKGRAAYLDQHPDDDETTDQRSSEAEAADAASPFSTFQTSLGSSFRRIRTQSFPAIHLPWPAARSRGTSPTKPSNGRSSAHPSRAGSGIRPPRSKKGSAATSPRATDVNEDEDGDDAYSRFTSSDEDDEDELRVLAGDDDDDYDWALDDNQAAAIDSLRAPEDDVRSSGLREDESHVDGLVDASGLP